MEQNKQIITIVLVLVIGLIGGYMIADHAGHGEDHEGMHKMDDHGSDRMMPVPSDMPASSTGAGMQSGSEAQVQ